MKLGIIMTRVSSDEQNKGNSPMDQLRACSEYARANGIHVPDDMIFHEDYTGCEYHRPELDKIRKILERQRGMVLIVRSGDRLARKNLIAMMIASDLVHYDTDLHFVSHGKIDIRSPEGLLFFQMEAAGSEYWGAKAKEAMRNGRRAQAESGIPTGQGPAPYGYRKEGKRRETCVFPYEPEATIVRLIFEWYVIEQIGPVEIARRLNARGEPSPAISRNHNYSYVKYGKWTPPIIHKILRNEAYIGKLYFYKTRREGTKDVKLPREEWLPVQTEAIISPEMFIQARKRAQERVFIERGRPSKYLYLMGRLLKCGCCGRSMAVATNTRNGQKYHYYSCNSNHSRMPELQKEQCTLPYFRADDVDYEVWRWLDELYRDPEKLRERLKEAQRHSSQNNTPIYDEIAVLERQKQALEHQLGEMISDQYRVGTKRSRAAFANLIADTEQSIEEAENRLMELRKRLEPLSITDEFINGIVESARELNEGRRPTDPWIGIVQGGIEPIVGILPLNRDDPETYHVARREIEKLNVTGTLAVEGEERVIYLHWNKYEARLVVNERVSLLTRSWEDHESGQRRSKTFVRAEEVLFLDPRQEQDTVEAVDETTDEVPF